MISPREKPSAVTRMAGWKAREITYIALWFRLNVRSHLLWLSRPENSMYICTATTINNANDPPITERMRYNVYIPPAGSGPRSGPKVRQLKGCTLYVCIRSDS